MEALVGLYADDVLLLDAWGGWLLSGREDWRSAVEAWFGSLGEESVSAGFELLRETSGEGLVCASALVTYAATAPDGTPLRSNRERLTWVAALRPEGWRIVQSHGSMPLDPETGRALPDDRCPAPRSCGSSVE